MDPAFHPAIPATQRGSLFISYARQDDEAFVARLHDDLAALGFRLWWDRRCMPNRGLAFLREIRDAIVGAGRLLFIFGPNAVQSDYVRAEWQYAYSIGTPVVTLLRLGDYDLLPKGLKHFDVLDFRQDGQYAARLAALIRQLDQPVSPLGRLVGVPELPTQFQARPQDLAAIRAPLLRDSREAVVLTTAGRRAGIQGMGGIGKSVLAAAVVRDFDVRRAFPDGLVWVAVGPDPNLPLRLTELCRALGDPVQSFVDPEQGRARLSELLADRAMLLALDDAWQLEHVRAFDGLGPRCALFVTTRDERLLDELGAFKLGLDLLSPDDALRLMAKWLEPADAVVENDSLEEEKSLDQLAPDFGEEARLVAKECGYLPLALALSAAQVRDGVAWRSLLEALRDSDLQYLDHPNGSVFRSIKTSVDALEREDRRHARHYLELAVFPQGANIPEAAVMTLWGRAGGLNTRTADKLIATLARRAMIHLTGQAPGRLIQLHDLQHDYARAAASDFTALHRVLLGAYRETFSGDWCEGPNDGYFFQHAAFHLASAERFEELRVLLTASPAWMEAAFRASTGDSQFAADLELSLRTPLGRQPLARIAILTAREVIYHRVGAYSDSDLETLALLGRAAEALNHARLWPEPSERVRVLVRLHRVLKGANQLHEDLLPEILALASQLKPGDYQARAPLSDLSLALFEAGRAAEALEIAHIAKSGEGRGYARDGLVAALEKQRRFSDAAAVARLLPEARMRAEELLHVARAARAGGMPDFAKALIEEAVSEVRAADGRDLDSSGSFDSWRTEAMQGAAEFFGAEDADAHELWIEALEIILRHKGYRDYNLEPLVIKLARLGKTELVSRGISGSTYPEHFRSQVAPQISRAAAEAAQFDTALAVIAIIEDPAPRAQALAAMLLPMREAGDNRIEAVIHEAVGLAGQIEASSNSGRLSAYGSVRAQTFCMLAEILARMQDPRVSEMLEPALADARGTSIRKDQAAEALAAVAQSMIRLGFAETAVPLLDEALALAGENPGSFFNLAVMMAEIGDFDRALLAASQVAAPNDPSSALRSVAETFAKVGRSDFARRAVDSIADANVRDSARSDAAAKLASVDAGSAQIFFEEALLNRSWPLRFVFSSLVRVPECWTPELIDHALSALCFVEKAEDLREPLIALLFGLAARRWRSTWEKAIETATRLDLLASLADELARQCEQTLDTGDLETALLLARSVANETRRPPLLARVAIAMAETGDPSALEVARSIDGDARSLALEAVALARAKAGDPSAAAILEERLAASLDSASVSRQDSAVRKVAKALASLGDLDASLAALSTIVEARERVSALADVAPALQRSGCLNRGLQIADLIDYPIICARAMLILADASSDHSLIGKALQESQLEATPPQAALTDWITTLCELAAKHAADDPLLARSLLDAAHSAAMRTPDRGFRSQQQAFIARAIAEIGWFDEALAAARAVEDGAEYDYGTIRGTTVGCVADAMAKAGRDGEARATAMEADRISTEALMAILSIAPATPPEGFESEHSRRIEALLAAPDSPNSRSKSAQPPSHPLEVLGLENFLAALADRSLALERESPGLGLAALKEATRVGGWISPVWRKIFESILECRLADRKSSSPNF